MKKYQIFWVVLTILFVSMPLSAKAGLVGNFFQSDEYRLSISGQNGWKALADSRGRLVEYVNPETGALVYVAHHPDKVKFTSAQEFAKDFLEVYDGWVYQAGRRLEGHELSRFNAASGFVVMYNKNTFSEGARSKIIVIEYYLIKEDKRIRLSAKTTDRNWLKDKDAILSMFDSFRFD